MRRNKKPAIPVESQLEMNQARDSSRYSSINLNSSSISPSVRNSTMNSMYSPIPNASISRASSRLRIDPGRKFTPFEIFKENLFEIFLQQGNIFFKENLFEFF